MVHSFKLSRDITGIEDCDDSLSRRIESIEIARQQASNFFDVMEQTLMSSVQSPQR